jgi:hypothetical protein
MSLNLHSSQSLKPVNRELELPLAELVDATGFSWRLNSGHLHDATGTFVEQSFYSVGTVLSFEVKATAVDPSGQLASWPLVAQVRACVAMSRPCAF